MNALSHAFGIFSHGVSKLAGRPITFVLAFSGILLWALTGPLFGFSETWQLVVNTATTIITFLMVFILQNSQNRDGEALQAKLDELILTSSRAENRFIGAERLDEEEFKRLRALLEEKILSQDDCPPAFADRVTAVSTTEDTTVRVDVVKHDPDRSASRDQDKEKLPPVAGAVVS